MKGLLILFVGVFVAGCSAGVGTSFNMPPAAPTLGGATLPPAGWAVYCHNQRKLTKPDPACLTPSRWHQLGAVQQQVNRQVTYVADTHDSWKIAQTEGDCEDFTLRYRQELLASGWPSNRLLPALCTTDDGEAHMNLLVSTDKGMFVLDNRFNTPRPLHQAACQYTSVLVVS